MNSDSKKLRWGILGLGKISNQFVNDLKLIEDVEIVACASRSISNAINFAGQYEISRSYGSYQELFEDAEVDIIYIGTTHNSHMNLSIEAMKNGKHVLCEKPIALDFAQVQEMADAAKKYDRVLVEAVWSQWHPRFIRAVELIQAGAIGKLTGIDSSFCFTKNFKYHPGPLPDVLDQIKLRIYIQGLKTHLNLDAHFLFSTKVLFPNHLTSHVHKLCHAVPCIHRNFCAGSEP